MEFGFVPAQVVKDLEELGNWKVHTARLTFQLLITRTVAFLPVVCAAA